MLVHVLYVTIIGIILFAWYRFAVDPLTKLWVRRGYYLLYKLVIKTNGFVIFLDIDDFKHINTKHGHRMGDQVLASIGQQIIKHSLQLRLLGCRFGGDEFAIPLPCADQRKAVKIAKQLREAIAKQRAGDDAISATITVANYEQWARMKHLVNKDMGKGRVYIGTIKGFEPITE